MDNMIKHIFGTKGVIFEADKRQSEPPKKQNPFKLIWFDIQMTDKQIRLNNSKYWQWEIVNNNFKCP